MAPPETLADLRARVQAPVRQYNDVAGVLLGDRLSIHVTRLFLVLGLSPTVATIAMLVIGLGGSVLVALGGAWSVAGFACMLAYYVLDCVDGEVARYHRREKLIWGFHEFLFHLYVKAAFFVALGLYAVRVTGASWTFFLALAALLACLFQKFLQDLSLVLACRYILLRGPAERERFVAQMVAGSAPDLAAPGARPSEPEPFRYRGPLPLLRDALTNFDLAVILFLAAAVADLILEPLRIAGYTADLKVLLTAFYGVVLPIDFVDRLQSHIRRRRFAAEARDLLLRAHHFRIAPRDGE